MSTKGKAESYIDLRGSLHLPDIIHGKSAYEIAVMNGFNGTEKEWLESLRSKPIVHAYINKDSEFVIVVENDDGTTEEINLGVLDMKNLGATVHISATRPNATNCIWFNTSGVLPTEGDTVLTLTDNADSGIFAEVNGETYGIGNIKEDDDESTKEYDYTLI